MKLNILKAEAVFQALLSLGSLFYVIDRYFREVLISEFFIALFFAGLSNLLGFLIRISVVKSILHRYYFFGVIFFFISLYVITSLTVDSNVDFGVYFMGAGGIFFNICYLVYGFYIIKNYHEEEKK